MANYPIGTKVHIEFDAVVEDNGSTGSDRLWTTKVREVQKDGLSGPNHYVYLSDQVATIIEPVNTDPNYWPPQLGDIWEASGEEYVVIADFGGNPAVYAVSKAEGFGRARLDEFKKLKPQLVRRRGAGLVDYVAAKAPALDDFCAATFRAA